MWDQAKAEAAAKLAAMTEADFADDPEGLSNWFKDKGNTLYKNKNFDEAVAMYSKAYDAHPANIAVLTNRAAVRFEQKAYDECIAYCKKFGRANRMINLDGGRTFFSTSLTRFSTSELLYASKASFKESWTPRNEVRPRVPSRSHD